MNNIWLQTSELAHTILESREVEQYLMASRALDTPQIQDLKQKLKLAQEAYDEAQRFGHFHPNYHEAKEQAKSLESLLHSQPEVAAYLDAERTLNELLFVVSKLLATSVSESIQTPNDMFDNIVV